MINRVEFEPDAIEDLDQMSPAIRDRILRKINWLALNLSNLPRRALSQTCQAFTS